MIGTFYINSGRFSDQRLSRNEVLEISQMGHEIGGHTLYHDNLRSLSYQDQFNTICTDKSNLESLLGKIIYSFAYPFGAETNDAKSITKQCGYTNARDSGGIRTPTTCNNCPSSVVLPLDRSKHYEIISISYRLVMELDGLKWQFEQVEAQYKKDPSKDYWIVFIFHEIGDFPSLPNSIKWSTLTDFILWVKTRPNLTVLPTYSVISNYQTSSTSGGNTPTTILTSGTTSPLTSVDGTGPATTGPATDDNSKTIAIASVITSVGVILAALIGGFVIYRRRISSGILVPQLTLNQVNHDSINHDCNIEEQWNFNTLPVGVQLQNEWDHSKIELSKQMESIQKDMERQRSATSVTLDEQCDIEQEFEFEVIVL
jgi:hypothetical protein